MTKLIRKVDDSIPFEQSCSLLNIIAECMRSLSREDQHAGDITINLDLFHKHLLRVSERNAMSCVKALFGQIVQSNPQALIWVHSVDAFYMDSQVVILRLGHDGVLAKHSVGFKTTWSQLVDISLDLEILKLTDGREEFVIKVPAAARLETEPAPHASFDLELKAYPEVS